MLLKIDMSGHIGIDLENELLILSNSAKILTYEGYLPCIFQHFK